MRAESTIRCNQSPRSGEQGARSFLSRFLTRDAGHLLLRNTVASSLAFVLGLALMWIMVDRLGSNAVMAAGVSFLAANSIHYSLAQAWVFRGSDRGWSDGFVYFFVNAAVGLVITILIFALLMRWTSLDYLSARVLVSIFAGLAIFALNATLNFKRL